MADKQAKFIISAKHARPLSQSRGEVGGREWFIRRDLLKLPGHTQGHDIKCIEMKFRGLLIEFLRIYSVRSRRRGLRGIVIFHRRKKKKSVRRRHTRDIKI